MKMLLPIVINIVPLSSIAIATNTNVPISMEDKDSHIQTRRHTDTQQSDNNVISHYVSSVFPACLFGAVFDLPLSILLMINVFRLVSILPPITLPLLHHSLSIISKCILTFSVDGNTRTIEPKQKPIP